MNRCPNDHPAPPGLDYCEECGARITTGDSPAPPPTPPPPPPTWTCRTSDCDTTQPHSRFCEACGEPNPHHPDFADTGDTPPDTTAPHDHDTPTAETAHHAKPPTEPVTPRRWTLHATADNDYFRRVIAGNGPDSGGITFPALYPDRQFDLTKEHNFIGRRSRSRGIEPDVDLSGAPEDPGISHAHAVIVATGDTPAIVDLGSANGTYVNGAADPVPANTPVPLTENDTVHIGAWTRLTLRAA
ncbi:FHA domain-containing protein [Stackebrandtia albiflava]|uniref:FHA domain-containing protein n=1 Tax=Stackebrandtia albiflava TaxID=406432 RepID=UPI0031E9009A